MSDEQRERLLTAEQTERAQAEEEEEEEEEEQGASGSSSESPPVEEGLKREEGTEKVVLPFSAKPVAPVTAFKTAASNPTPSISTSSGTKPVPPQGAAEWLMFED